MKASATIVAPTEKQARERAEFAFRDFYGDQPYEIVSESAESYLVNGATQEISAWRCEFVAEGGE